MLTSDASAAAASAASPGKPGAPAMQAPPRAAAWGTGPACTPSPPARRGYADRFAGFEDALNAIDGLQLRGFESMLGVALERVRGDSRESVDDQIDALHAFAADPGAADPGHDDPGNGDVRGAGQVDERGAGQVDERAAGRIDARGIGPDDPASRAAALSWLRDQIGTSTLTAVAHALDVTTSTAWSRVASAATAFICMPRLSARVRAGALSFDRFAFAAGQASSVDPPLLNRLDELIAEIRATKKSEYIAEVKAAIATLYTREQQAQEIRERRRVDAFYDRHGRGTLVVQGPSTDIALLYARLEGTARCVVRGYTVGFDLPDNHVFADARSFEQLKYDFLMGATIGGTANTLDTAQRRLAEHHSSMGGTGVPVDALADDIAELLSETQISCPTDGQWLERQARISITVPAMTLADAPGADSLPGTVDGNPVSPDVARRLVGTGRGTVYRLLTDPRSGEVLNEVATTYTISARMRHSLMARWHYCTAPGCDRPAAKAELDHIEPFDHRHPDRGGPTSMENLHPLCKQHHQLKTQGVFRLRAEPRTGVLTWTLPGGTTAATHPPGSVVQRRHAEIIAAASASTREHAPA